MRSFSCLSLRTLTSLWAVWLLIRALLAPNVSAQVVAGVESPQRISANDNRVSAGTQVGNTLTIRLEARSGEWRPDRDEDPGVVVRAFAIEGGPLQIPGPLIRVVEGTEIRASIRNTLAGDPLVIHGLYSHPANGAAPDAVIVPPGETREVRFAAGKPGVYYYWAASSPSTTLLQRSGADSQLSGAFVIDPAGAPRPSDRVLLISDWANAPLPKATAIRIAINGRSWPNTERLAYRVGDTVRMRIINAGSLVHPMHLHGFYFNVDSRGDERTHTTLDAGSPHMAVTERTGPGATFSLTWLPTRPGNWLFHCHDNVHLERFGSLDGRPLPPAGANHHVENHALEMMAGPVMGITVTGESTEAATPPSVPRRQLRLVARVDAGGTETEPAFGYTLESTETQTPPPPPYMPSPTIVLKRGEPVSITVVNRLPEPTAVHWHGIELESYYDGVAGFAGDATRIAPAVQPGGTFEARFTPPRSGTFIYHTHIDEVRQQQAGLSGALLVVDAPERFDPEHDIVLMITVPRKQADARVVLLNGSSTPPAREMHVGQHYRLRFINVHTNRPSMRMRLLSGTTPLKWRALAKDGRDLPDTQAVEGTSEIQMGNGETYDFDFVPSTAGDIRLDVTSAAGLLLVSMPIHVQ
jgi:FtsP/CotA-like multicopper oxidase with cupredoxin domain